MPQATHDTIRNEYLHRLRKNQNMTMKDLASRIGSRYEVISRLESGKSSLTENMANRLAPHLETTARELLGGKSDLAPVFVDVTAGRRAVELLQMYDEVLPESAHHAIRGYIDHMVDFYTEHQDADENLPQFPRLNRTRDGWPWGLRHLGRVLTYKGAQVGVTYERLNIHRAKKVRVGKIWHWQTQMYVMGQSGVVESTGTYREGGPADSFSSVLATAVAYQSGVHPSNQPLVSYGNESEPDDVMYLFLRDTARTFICVHFAGEYTARDFTLTEGIAEEFLEEFGGEEFAYDGHSDRASSNFGRGS